MHTDDGELCTTYLEDKFARVNHGEVFSPIVHHLGLGPDLTPGRVDPGSGPSRVNKCPRLEKIPAAVTGHSFVQHRHNHSHKETKKHLQNSCEYFQLLRTLRHFC